MENYLTKEKNEKLIEKDKKEYEDFIKKLDNSQLGINGRSNNDRIAIYYILKEYDKAIECIKELFELQIRYNTDSIIGYGTFMYIGKIYYFRNDFNDAFYYFNRSKDKVKIINHKAIYKGFVETKEPEIDYCLGACLYQLKDYNRALINFKESINIDSDFFESYNMIALCYKELNNTAGYEYYNKEYIDRL